MNVDVNYGELIGRMKKEIIAEINTKMDDAQARTDGIQARLTDHVAESAFVLSCAKFASLRTVEDWVIKRMKTVANLPAELSHSETVEYFLRNYEVNGVPRKYFLSLRHSATRQTANNYVHVSPDDSDTIDTMWKSVSRTLSAEDKKKYLALMNFGRGLTNIRYVGGR